MQHRSLSLLLAAVAALGACKKSEKKEPAPGSGSAPAVVDAKPAPTLDAAPATAAIDATPAAAGDTITKPFFYKVSSKDGKSVHFLGSIHIGVDPKKLPPVVWDTARAAKSFAMEADVSNAMKAAMALAASMKRTDGKTLEQALGPDYWKKLQAALDSAVPGGVKMLNGMKAAMPAAMLQTQGMDPTAGIDVVFLQDAQSRNEKLVFLEEIETQGKIIADAFDERMLKWELDHLDDMAKKRDDLLAAYLAGDESGVGGLDEASDEELAEAGYTKEESDRLMNALLYDRNAAWIPPIEKLIAEGDAFIVVGAAHLIGDRSVLDLLAKKGYTVERVTP